MLKSNFNNFKTENLLIPLALFSILPFILLFLYVHPVADDYFYLDRLNNTGFYPALKSLYINWSGRIFSHSELLVSPLFFRTFTGYKIFVLLMMILLFTAIYFFVSEFAPENNTRKETLTICLSVFFLYLYKMDTVGQGFYWLTSVIVYHNSVMFLLLFYISYNKLMKSNRVSSKIIYTLTSCFFVIAVCLSNEVSMMFLSLSVVLLFMLNFFRKNYNLSLFLILMCVILSVYIDMASPGTLRREDTFIGNEDFIFSFLNSFKELFYNLFNWIFLSPLLPVTLLLSPVLLKFKTDVLPERSIFRISPFLIILFGGFLLYSGFFVAIFGQGKVPFGRTINIIYLVFLLIWFLIVISLLFKFSGKLNYGPIKIPGYVSIICFIIILIYLLNENNIKTAATDVLSGSAKRYDNELLDRYKTISESSEDSVIVRKLNNLPGSMFLYDIYSDPENIQNKWYAKHFNIKSIQTK